MHQVALADPEASGNDHDQRQGSVDRGQEQLSLGEQGLAPVGVVYRLVVVDGVGAGHLEVVTLHPGEG